MAVKAEIHCHIEGAASTALVAAQARKYAVNIEGLIDGDEFVWTDFTTFLAAYDKAAALFRTAEDYALLAQTYFESIAADGAIYGEVFISTNHAQSCGLDPLLYVEGLAEGMARAKASTGIETRMIATGLRHPESTDHRLGHGGRGAHASSEGFCPLLRQDARCRIRHHRACR
jgi:adenosine deaminase